jgi:hypothetical protein
VKVNGRTVQLCELISVKHDGVTIGNFLRSWKRFVLLNKPSQWCRNKIIVTDYSWAMINAVIHGLNEINIVGYLKKAYNKIIYEKDTDMVLLSICCVQFMKIVSNQIGKKCHWDVHS